MLKEGIKKELMFFTRSFRMWGVIIAAVLFAAASPLLMKLSFEMLSSIENMELGGDNDLSTQSINMDMEISGSGIMGDMTDESYMAKLGAISALGDLTSTLMLIFMLVTMYSAGGELKKRSMIIPQNAGLSSKLYILPKFIVYPASVALFAFCGIWIGFGISALVFGGIEISISNIAVSALLAAVFDAFMTVLYFTLGLCTSKAGLSVVIMYGGNVILTTLFSALGADKFHPFTLTSQAQNAVLENGFDSVNLWGSIGITVLLMVLCYFVTLFVISARRINNRGKEEMEL